MTRFKIGIVFVRSLATPVALLPLPSQLTLRLTQNASAGTHTAAALQASREVGTCTAFPTEAGAMLGAGVVEPDFRGQRIMPALMLALCATLRMRHVKLAFASCDLENASSRRTILHASFQELCRVPELWFGGRNLLSHPSRLLRAMALRNLGV